MLENSIIISAFLHYLSLQLTQYLPSFLFFVCLKLEKHTYLEDMLIIMFNMSI